MQHTKKYIIKSTLYVLACLPFILVSCSAYQKVSLLNFKEYNVSYNERGDLHYVLKKHSLHYSDTDSRNNNYYYETDQSTMYRSYSFLIEDNIVIPKGAPGVCVNFSEDNFIIDFGKGVLIPFKIHDGYNSAKSEIEVDGRKYNVEVSNRKGHLYFNTSGLKTSKSRQAGQ
jgi:hypothetical protein